MFQKMLIDYFQMGEKYVEALYQDKSVTKFLKLNYYYAIFEKNSPVKIGKRTVAESEAMLEISGALSEDSFGKWNGNFSSQPDSSR